MLADAWMSPEGKEFFAEAMEQAVAEGLAYRGCNEQSDDAGTESATAQEGILGEEFNPGDGKSYTGFWKTSEEGVDGINFEYYYARKSGDSGRKENIAEEAQKDAGEYLYGYKVEGVVEHDTEQVAYELSRENERVYIKTDVKSIEKINPEEFRRIAWEIQTFGKPLPKPPEQMRPEDFIPSKEELHQQLDALGMIPYLGMVVDALHGSWYWYEEDHVNAAMCAASIGIGVVPFGKIGAKVLSAAKIGAKRIAKMVRLGADTVTNPIPEKLARVIPGKDIPVNLGPEGAKDVFVTAAEDIRGLNPKEISERLAVPYSKTYTIIEWNKPATGMATPINRLNPNFVGGGLTKGGAREYVIPNQLLPQDAKIRIVE